ncbi:MAG TPA: sugar transferase [Acidimicrobiales bacterium]|nr:sugar transferase [Acidimicrobiales bacterium]
MSDNGIFAVDELARAVPLVPVRPVVRAGPGAVAAEAVSRGWWGKRAVDVTLGIVLVLVTLPVFVIIAIVIKATSSGPVLFRQRRVGRGGKDFPMLKFRTMHTGSEEKLRSDPALHELFVQGSHKIPSHLDPRITRVGRVLRRLSLDEMPQLLNVVLGHMSIVGPRPVERSQLLRDYGDYQTTYTAMRPGLTGLWQVSGRSTVQFPERALLDCHYLERCGPWTDAKILLRTPVAVFTGLGAD